MPVPFDGPALDPPIKVAVTSEAHGYPIDPQILAGIERAADVLSDAGYTVERVATPSIMKPAQAWFDVLASEIAYFLGPVAREHGSELPSKPSLSTTSASGTLSIRPDTARPSPIAPR